MDLSRLELLVGKECLEKIKNSHVAIVGVGGVGGYVCEMLARSGISKFTLVDFDVVSSSNLNRQIIALEETIGKLKVEVMKERILKINKDANVLIFPVKIGKDNFDIIFQTKPSMIVDAIDMLKNKVELIAYANENSLPIVSACGAGNRVKNANFYITDIFKTKNDGLAKVLRKKLRAENIKHLEVAVCDELPIKNSAGVIGSISYFPAMCGCKIAEYVILKIKE